MSPYLPDTADVDELLRAGTPDDWWRIVVTYRSISTWQQVSAKTGDTDVTGVALAKLPAVTALQALAAKQQFSEWLTGARWIDMRDAREQGASWTEIGASVGQSRQAVRQWYLRAIERQEFHAGAFHDIERARAALADG